MSANVIPFKTPEPQKPKYVPQYRDFRGSKYESGLDIAEIAKRIRGEIKELVKTGSLPKGKYSVKISRYSGGQSLNVKIKDLETQRLILNPERVASEKAEPYGYRDMPIYSKYGKGILDLIKALVDAYNFDNSDPMTDYFHKNFYGFVDYDYGYERQIKAMMEEYL